MQKLITPLSTTEKRTLLTCLAKGTVTAADVTTLRNPKRVGEPSTKVLLRKADADIEALQQWQDLETHTFTQPYAPEKREHTMTPDTRELIRIMLKRVTFTVDDITRLDAPYPNGLSFGESPSEELSRLIQIRETLQHCVNDND